MSLAGLAFPLARPLLHALDAETAHGLTIRALKALPGAGRGVDDPRLRVEAFGLSFANPLGLAAGFDKNAEVPDQMLALGHRLNALACDDAHFELDDAFGAWTMVRATERSPEALLAALKAGHYYSSTGVELRDIRVEGDELVVECSPATGIYLQGKGSREVHAIGHDLTHARLPAYKLGKQGFMRLTVLDAQGRRAWSNPFWREG